MPEFTQTVFPYFMAVPANIVARMLLDEKLDIITHPGVKFMVDYIVRTHQEYMASLGKVFDHANPTVVANLVRMHLMACINGDAELMTKLNNCTARDFFNIHTANLDAWEFYKSIP